MLRECIDPVPLAWTEGSRNDGDGSPPKGIAIPHSWSNRYAIKLQEHARPGA